MDKVFSLNAKEIEEKLSDCVQNGMTEFFLHDGQIAKDKSKLIRFLKFAYSSSESLFVSVLAQPKIVDSELCSVLQEGNSCLEMDFCLTVQGFDKKLFARKCALLNNAALVFGVRLYFANLSSDSLKQFKERLDFTVNQYPNHIEFPQLETKDSSIEPSVTGIFSANDVRTARNIAFSCRTFYTAGRAVPWFCSILHCLKITSSVFFLDFAEWQKVNNCDYKSGFVPEKLLHEEIEKMQLLFLNLKFEEKHLQSSFIAAKNIVLLNGAFSRLVAEGKESVISLDYNPDDLLSPESMDIVSFANNVCMEHCSVKIFENDGQPDYKII